MSAVRSGDLVVLLTERGRRYLLEMRSGGEFHCQSGRVPHDDLIGQPYGSPMITERGQRVVPLQPSTLDLVLHLRRQTQIVYPKDIAYLLLWMDIRPGKRVIEAGTGSGAMTVALAQHVRPTGRVYSYERRQDIQDVARGNLERYGLLRWVSLKSRDISQGFEESEVDALFLDVREPWDYLEQAQAALQDGGFFGSLVPTVNQLSHLVDELNRVGFIGIEIKELLLRPYKVNANRLRPEDRMVAHTGYLVLSRAPADPRPKRQQADLASLRRDELLTMVTRLTRSLMVDKARRRRRRQESVQYH